MRASGSNAQIAVALVVALAVGLAGCPDPPGLGLPNPQPDRASDDGWELPAPRDTVETAVVSCTDDESCEQANREPCVDARCDAGTGICRFDARPDGTPCTSGNLCFINRTCAAGVCAGGDPRPPDCGSRRCGLDLCGNECGSCEDGQVCDSTGRCHPEGETPLPCGDVAFEGCCTAAGTLRWCEGGALSTVNCAAAGAGCGWNQLFYDCVTSESAEPSGTIPYLCAGEQPCANVCAGRECGFDCGTSCGSCGDGMHCAGGSCVPDACGEIPAAGCCDGLTLRWCAGGELREATCESECGWDGGRGAYNCGKSGEDPDGVHARSCATQRTAEEGAPPETVGEGAEPVEPAVEADAADATESGEVIEAGEAAGSSE